MTRAAERPPDPGAVQGRPLDVAAPLPRAAVGLSLPDWVQRLVVAPGQAHRGLHGGIELRLSRLYGWLIGRAGVNAGLFGGAQVGEITDDVVLGVAQARKQDFCL